MGRIWQRPAQIWWNGHGSGLVSWPAGPESTSPPGRHAVGIGLLGHPDGPIRSAPTATAGSRSGGMGPDRALPGNTGWAALPSRRHSRALRRAPPAWRQRRCSSSKSAIPSPCSPADENHAKDIQSEESAENLCLPGEIQQRTNRLRDHLHEKHIGWLMTRRPPRPAWFEGWEGVCFWPGSAIYNPARGPTALMTPLSPPTGKPDLAQQRPPVCLACLPHATRWTCLPRASVGMTPEINS